MLKTKKYRLRLQNNVIGFAHKTPSGFIFRGNSLVPVKRKVIYDEIDEYTSLQDVNQQEIYELDIVVYSIAEENRCGVVLWNGSCNGFGVYDIDNFIFIPLFLCKLCLFQRERLEVVSHLFEQPELKRKIGLDDLC